MSPIPSTLPDLTGKVFLVTGGNAGIGYETIRQLLAQNATVFMGARSPTKAATSIASLKETHPNAIVESVILDHASLSSVVSAAKSLQERTSRLDGMITNAGIMATPYEITADGYEAQWQTNYLSHWLLTYHLLPLLTRTAKLPDMTSGSVRIVNVTSMGHSFAPKVGIDYADINQEKGSGWSRYGQSKLANILHAKELARRYGSSDDGGIWTAAVHPGNVNTDINRNAQVPEFKFIPKEWILSAFSWFGVFIPVSDAGKNLCLAAVGVSPDLQPYYPSGSYIVPVGKVQKPSANAQNAEMATKLWDWTFEQMKSKGLLD